MIEKTIGDIKKVDIERLVNDRIQEGRTLDFKRDLTLGKDEDRRELARDVASFANAVGGDLVFGLDEARNEAGEKLGYPAKAPGLTEFNFDAAKLRIESIVRDIVDPKVPALQFQVVDGFERGPVLILRVTRSWNGPHMLTYQKQTHFFSRNSAGRHGLDVREVRALFLASNDAAVRPRRFRDERIGAIFAESTPVPLPPTAKLLVHLVPLAAFENDVAVDVAAVDITKFPPPVYASQFGWDNRHNLDGFVSYFSPASAKPEDPRFAYTQFFRSGAVEAVDAYTLEPRNEKLLLKAYGVEARVIMSVERYAAAIRGFGVSGPIAVFVSLLGVKGYVVPDPSGWKLPYRDGATIDRDIVLLPEAMLQDDATSARTALKPAFDTLWQAAGWSKSTGYDASGAWREDVHRDWYRS